MRNIAKSLAALVGLLLLSGCAPEKVLQKLSHRMMVGAAEREGVLIVYANTGDVEAVPVVEEFRRRYPGIKIIFDRQNAAQLNDRYISESKSGRTTADLVWSSAMDLQIKLINDGFALTYVSPQKSALPGWAVWKNQGYGVTAEPIVFVYDRRRLEPARAPRSHSELRQALERHELPGIVATFDPARSGVGFLYYSQDRLASADTLALNRAIGQGGVELFTSTGTLLQSLRDGKTIFGYNVVGSYAQGMQRTEPNIQVIFPNDYTLVMSRIAFISRRSPHPNAAKLFLNFILSREGQLLLAKGSLRPVRLDLDGGGVPGPPATVARPIEVGPSLLANLDQMRRARLLGEWQEAIGPKRNYDLRRVRDEMAPVLTQ